MSQTQRITYQAIDEKTGTEVIGLEFRRGLMNEETMKSDESKLLPFFIQFLQDAKESVK